MYEIIDAHVHIYPDSIVDKATANIRNFYNAKNMPSVDGHTSSLIQNGRMLGVQKYVVHSCATSLHQVKPINDFIYSQMQLHSEFIGFLTLYPGMNEEEIIDEISKRYNQGFKGIKLHPDFQKFNIDDEVLYPIYKYASSKMPILFHVGDPRSELSRPYKLAKIAKMFPNLTCIGAHFGGWYRWEELDCYLGLDNVYFDTSSTLAFLSNEKALKLMYKHGIDKFFFGTDFPMWDIKIELDRVLNLGLSSVDLEKVLSKNFKRVFNID